MTTDHLTVLASVAGAVVCTYCALAAWKQQRAQALSVNVSFNRRLDTRYIAGWMHFHDPSYPASIRTVPLAVDKPELLLNPKPRTVQSIWEQIEAAGYVPYSLEIILANKKKRVFRYEHGVEPVFEY